MSAPDADRKPGEVPIPPEALAAGQRMLAAIVFTDTVGFSALMTKEEELTLRLVARDLEHMKAACGAFGGRVLKSTGDGLLMLFTSAVQAVACALEIQRGIQKQNLELPQVERLQHRIGIHLGDVFQNGGDVMGDGVNIAARLQTEAVPGGICLSKTVYDVVHNRLSFYVNDLGARKLKNIGKVTAYQISPMESGPGTRHFGLTSYHWRFWIRRGAALFVALVIVAIIFELGGQYRHRMYLRAHPHAPAAGSNVATHPPSPATAFSSPLTGVPTAAPEVSQASETEFQEATFRYMTKYDFDGMETWMREHDWPGKGSDPLAKACPQLSHLVTWCHEQLQTYSFAKPLKVEGALKTFYYWPAPFGGVGTKSTDNGAPLDATIKSTLLSGDQIRPLMMAGIARALIKEKTNPTDPLAIQLNQELQLFVQTYHVVFPSRKPAQGEGSPSSSSPVEATPGH